MTAPLAANESMAPGSGDVIRRAQAGDMAAFEILYKEHSPRVYALCLRLCGTKTDATELMQDTFIRAWRGLGSFRGESAFSSWLHRLAVNAMLESARSEKRRTARVLPMEDPGTIGAIARSESPDLQMDLERAIASLPQGARIAFVLHEIEGYKHEEIAAQLGIAPGTVKAQLHRARKLLIQALNR